MGSSKIIVAHRVAEGNVVSNSKIIIGLPCRH